MTIAKSIQRAKRVRHTLGRGLSLMSRLRISAVLYTLVIIGATWGVIILMSGAWIPVIGVACVAVAMSVNKATNILKRPVCLNCGGDLSNQPNTLYGVACPGCGTLTLPIALSGPINELDDRLDDDAEALADAGQNPPATPGPAGDTPAQRA
ncbi:MAG: hypothetical protein K2X32_01875 [Phycisphaerales bacterium]|nr:hypothetical protein [Phycisphaerales bacterium]